MPRGGARSGRLHSGPGTEAKLSHLDDLTASLDAAGIEAATLTELEAPDAKVMPKARRKVLDQGLGGRDYTEAMRDTPRRQLRRRALRGHWDAYPVDPAGPYEVLASMFEGRDHIAKSSSFARVREFEETLEELEDDGDAAGLLAVRRATLTAVAELAHRNDDSYGTVGDLGRQCRRSSSRGSTSRHAVSTASPTSPSGSAPTTDADRRAGRGGNGPASRPRRRRLRRRGPARSAPRLPPTAPSRTSWRSDISATRAASSHHDRR